MWIASESSLSLIMQSVVIPAATEWLSTWAARHLHGAKRGQRYVPLSQTEERQPGSCADIVITAYSRTHNSVAAFPLASPTDRNWLLCLFKPSRYTFAARWRCGMAVTEIGASRRSY